MNRKTFITAHSGCDGTPDNSMEFVRFALSLDVDCLEIDVRISSGGALVISHDECDHGVPLSDVFAAVAAREGMCVNCDLKQAGLEMPVWTLAREYGIQTRLIYSGEVSFDFAHEHPRIIEELAWYMNVELIFPGVRDWGTAIAPEDAADKIRDALSRGKARCLNAHYGIIDTPLYEALRQRGVPLSLWTVNDPALIARLLRDGILNITTRSAVAALSSRSAGLSR